MVNIYLIGFMGAGKSTVGPLLAKRLELPYADLDACIVARAGMTITEIFSRFGEARFREMEIAELGALPGPAVISLGGGAFTTPAVREHTAAHGISVYLDWPLDVLRARVGRDPSRPLARDPEGFARRFHERQPIYAQARVVWRSQPPHRESVETVVEALVTRLRPLGDTV